MSAFQIKPGPLYRASKPVRDPKFLRYVRQFPCIACKKSRRIEAAHVGPHGLSQKASDIDAVSLCDDCHRTGPHAIHKIGRAAFEAFWKVDIATFQRMFQRFYLLRHGGGDWWPRRPDLTLQTCPQCEHAEFAEEIGIGGCSKCGYREERAA